MLPPSGPDVGVSGAHHRPDAGGTSLVGEPFESWREGNFVGTPDQVAEKIQTYVDLGCTGFSPWCSDYPDTETMRHFAAIADQFRRGARRTDIIALDSSAPPPDDDLSADGGR